MDKNSAVALTVGLGALGTVLAYYGYNQLNTLDGEDAEFNNNNNKTDTPTRESAVASASELRQIVQQRKEKTSNTIEANVKLAIEELKKAKVEEVESSGSVDSDAHIRAGAAEDEIKDKKATMSDKEKWSEYWKNEYTELPADSLSPSDYN